LGHLNPNPPPYFLYEEEWGSYLLQVVYSNPPKIQRGRRATSATMGQRGNQTNRFFLLTMDQGLKPNISSNFSPYQERRNICFLPDDSFKEGRLLKSIVELLFQDVFHGEFS